MLLTFILKAYYPRIFLSFRTDIEMRVAALQITTLTRVYHTINLQDTIRLIKSLYLWNKPYV
jgi:hypothetical protein